MDKSVNTQNVLTPVEHTERMAAQILDLLLAQAKQLDRIEKMLSTPQIVAAINFGNLPDILSMPGALIAPETKTLLEKTLPKLICDRAALDQMVRNATEAKKAGTTMPLKPKHEA